MHLQIGTILNNNCYRIKKYIGQGGFGITYLAEEIGFYRNTGFGDAQYVSAKEPELVVVKELYYSDYCQRDQRTGLINISNSERRLEFTKLVENQLNEGKKLRSLDHPHIVRTRDIFKENDTAYLVMDYVESTDLEDILKKAGRIEKSKSIKYTLQILSALAHIHERNKLHLDVKPSNILIRKGKDEAVLIDFGASQSYDSIGKIVGKTSQLIAGMTKHYAPNEQADIDNLKTFDATFDTYAIGATLYHLLTGNKPPLSSLLSTGRERLIPPSEYVQNNDVSDYIDAIIAKALSPLYHQRFKTAAEFEIALNHEREYQQQIHEINKLLVNTSYQQALDRIMLVEKNFLLTPTLNRLKQTTQPEAERLRREQEKYSEERTEIVTPKQEQYKKIERIIPVAKSSQQTSKKPILLAATIVIGVVLVGIAIAALNREIDTNDIEVTTLDTIATVDTISTLLVDDSVTGTSNQNSLPVDKGSASIANNETSRAETLEKNIKAIALVEEANKLCSQGSGRYDEALLKYLAANKLVPHSADEGHDYFLVKGKQILNIDSCDKGAIELLRKAQRIHNTAEVRNLLNKCR